jgi:hypothetical protein
MQGYVNSAIRGPLRGGADNFGRSSPRISSSSDEVIYVSRVYHVFRRVGRSVQEGVIQEMVESAPLGMETIPQTIGCFADQ